MSLINPLVFDPSTYLAEMAMDGLSLRRDVIGQNIANIDTPQYKAETVDFETALARAMKNRTPLGMARTNAAHLTGNHSGPSEMFTIALRKGGSVRADGNNVDVDQELVQLSETSLRYDALTRVVSKKLALMKNIASSR